MKPLKISSKHQLAEKLTRANGIDFGDYIEDVMARLAEGDTDHASMIACNYKPRQAEANAKTA